ncbi:hypothetical protein KY333_01650 [Candidatus Woesearchaeota archaeon]|nr:hypothetical protein [Candidatus Woesearchaeota archaeon]MBW2994394.1 hypothetical protein [Candidatus Woesearchaeota archaeon]
MEKTMLIMIVIVAIVAIGGLLYINSDKSDVAPVFVESPSAPAKAPADVLGSAGGQIRFKVVPVTDSAGGQIKFSMK